MMDIDVKSKLLMGLDIEIHNITIKNYKLGEIFRDIGLIKYLQMTSVVNKKARDFIKAEYLDEVKDIKIFDVFCMSKDMQKLLSTIMNFFTGYEWNFVVTSSFSELLATNQDGVRVHINRDNYEDVLDVIKAMYCLDETKRESDRDDIDEEMRELLLEFEEEEAKVKAAKGSKLTLVSIIDGISNKHNSINLLNIWDYRIYQIMHTYYILNKIDNEDRLMTAIYSGTIDSKKAELEGAHWANEV